MRAYPTPQQQAVMGLLAIEELSPTASALYRFSLSNRILAAIREIDSNVVDFDTGTVTQTAAAGKGRIQRLERAAALIFTENGQLMDDFAFISEA